MRSTPEQDQRLRARLQEAVDQFAGGSADRFGQLIGYANGGYIRQILLGARGKQVRETLIDRVHAQPEMSGWFDPVMSSTSRPRPVASARWPFESISPQQWARLTERQKGAVEDAALQKIRELDAFGAAAAPSGKRQVA